MSLILGLYGVAGGAQDRQRDGIDGAKKSKKCKFICIYEKNIVIVQPKVKELTFINHCLTFNY